jgi:hypothetical protein
MQEKRRRIKVIASGLVFFSETVSFWGHWEDWAGEDEFVRKANFALRPVFFAIG